MNLKIQNLALILRGQMEDKDACINQIKKAISDIDGLVLIVYQGTDAISRAAVKSAEPVNELLHETGNKWLSQSTVDELLPDLDEIIGVAKTSDCVGIIFVTGSHQAARLAGLFESLFNKPMAYINAGYIKINERLMIQGTKWEKRQ